MIDRLELDLADLLEMAIRPHLRPYDHFRVDGSGRISYIKYWPGGSLSVAGQVHLHGTKLSLYTYDTPGCGCQIYDYDLADPNSLDQLGRQIMASIFWVSNVPWGRLSHRLQRKAVLAPTITKI